MVFTVRRSYASRVFEVVILSVRHMRALWLIQKPTGDFYTTWKSNPSSQMWFFVQLCSTWQDFNWLKPSRGHSATAELFVDVKFKILLTFKHHSKYSSCFWNQKQWGHSKVRPSTFGMAGELKLCFVLFNHDLVVECSIKFLDRYRQWTLWQKSKFVKCYFKIQNTSYS